MYRNYETCLAVMCFSEANRDGRYAEMLRRKADAFLKSIQWDQGEGLESSDPGLWGRGLRFSQAARPIEHGIFGRSTPQLGQ